MEKYTGFEIAVIGLSGKFPEAANINQYWENLKQGKDCISTFSTEDVLAEGESERIAQDPNYVRAHGYVKDKEYFDAAFFDYRPDEAELMDPQIRMFHQCCWEALEDSGYSGTAYKDKVGLFAAGSPNVNWVLYSTYKNRDGLVDDFAASYLREVSFLSTSISYKLNLKGPSIFLQTACSSSLVAIHEACNSLLWGECSMALAGGVTIRNYSRRGYLYKPGMILSRDGKCRPFDQESDGTVGGEGVGVVVLKRLKDAMADRDHIYAVVKGVGVNNDGSDKVGYTAPSVKGQVDAIRKAHKMAGVSPTSINYVETHGTATSLGDPIEIEALNEAFGNGGGRAYCAIGSVKSNIGHLDTAAGVAGFIKAVLALKHKQIPASLHFKEANPKIDFTESPFYVNAALQAWKRSGGPLRAGVSSFGIGGTNAHVVLEEAPVVEHARTHREDQLIVLSGRTKESLARNTEQFINYLKQDDASDLADVAYTLQQGRVRFPYRKMLVAKSKAEAIEMLSSGRFTERHAGDLQEDLQNIVFMFSGQGFQYVNMCRGLYDRNVFFRTQVDTCLDLAKRSSKADFRSVLFSDGSADSVIDDTRYTQPLLFIVEYCVCQLLQHWGVRPHYMIGHSIGEYVAACISGVFTLESCLRIVIRRGELMSGLEGGSMLSIQAGAAVVEPLLAEHQDVDVAVVNSAGSVVVSGSDAAIGRFKGRVEAAGYGCKVLATSHAFHSYMMDGILGEFEREVSAVTISAPQIPYISNLTGDFVTYDEIRKPSYWSKHLRHTVRFAEGVDTLLRRGKGIFIEVGPGRGLCNYVSEHELFGAGHHVLNTVRQSRQQVDDAFYLTERLGYLWLNGVTLDWNRYYQGESRGRVSLPTYSFEKTFYTTHVDARKLVNGNLSGGPAVGKDDVVGLYSGNWQRSVLPNEANELSAVRLTFVVITGASSFGESLIDRLRSSGQHVVEVKTGKSFAVLREDVVQADLGDPESLGAYLSGLGVPINHVVYCSALSAAVGTIGYEALDEKLDVGYLGLSYLAKCIAGLKQVEKINLTVVDNYLAGVMGVDEVDPIKATIHGPARIIPSELLNVSSRVIDIPYPFRDAAESSGYISQIINEIFYESADAFVAYRYQERWVRAFGTVPLNKKLGSGVEIVRKGTYLITGGFGGMGFTIARDLADRQVRRVILVTRSSFPDRSVWETLLADQDTPVRISEKIRQILEMERVGCSVELHQVDVSQESAVKEFLSGVMAQYAKVDGLIWAAGEVDYGGIIEKREPGDFIKYLSSKVHGVLLFAKYMDFNTLDFVALFSSIGNVLYQGKFGQVGYNASNEFLDSYAYYLQKAFGVHAFSINWCDWLDVGMTVNTIGERLGTDEAVTINSEIPDGIAPQEGVTIFHTCLAHKGALTTVYKGDLQARIDSYLSGFNAIRDTLTSAGDPVHVVAPTDLAGELLGIFSGFFGRDDIRIDDDFFELGGDSLKGMTLVARINQRIGSGLTIGDLYRWSTIRQITEALLDHEADASGRHIPKAPEKPYYILSSAQKRMYFLQMLDQASTAYNEVQTLWVSGTLDKAKLEGAFRKLIDRHESLRTSFVYVDDLPMQVVSADVLPSITYYQYDEATVADLIRSFIRPHDFVQAPLFRIGVIEKSATENLLIIDMHHIITDLVSANIFRQDLITLYNADLPALKLQYKDYAEWQQSDEQQQKIAGQKEFWVNAFAEIPEVLSLPTDYKRPAQKSNVGNVLHFELGAEETAQLVAMAGEEEVSLFMVLLSLYTILLSKLSGQEDLVVGIPTAGRQHADLENIVGMFINTIALRNQPKGNLRFKDYLSAVKAKTLSSFDNQNYPYEELIEALDIERDVSRSPLFDVMFNFKSIDQADTAVPLDLTFNVFSFEQQRSKFDITFWALQSADRLQLSFEYSTALFKPSTIKQFEAYFRTLVARVIADRTIQLKDVSLLAEAEYNRQLRDFNATTVAWREGETVLDLFRDQVSRVPFDVAVADGLRQLSYQDLDDLSDGIAWHLREGLGIAGGSLIGLLLDRELLLIPVILGVLKAGCTYVPIDPVYPSERVEMIMNQSGMRYLITRDGVGAVKNTSACDVLDLKEIIEALQESPKRAFTAAVGADDLAYVIYTSGSTGNPKGLIINHSSLHNYICWAKDYYTGNEALSFALFTSISFDLTVTSIFTPLATGGKIVIYGGASGAVSVEDVFRDNQSDVIKLTPSHLQIISASGLLTELPQIQVKTLIVGGEMLETTLARSIHEQSGGRIAICNEYGPTEATVGCMIYNYNHDDDFVSVPIGVPIANTQIYLLDRYLQPVAAGVPGQIYIAGKCLSLGYLSQVALTAEKFIPNVFEANALMYATGDSGVRRAGGIIEYQGRADDQIKIRGFRIEPGEIQYHLDQHPHVRDSVVLVKGEASDRYLVGYYVSATPIAPGELRAYLLNGLPEYMVPMHYVHLTAFPLDANGKLLRSKLPEVALHGKSEMINPSNPLEQKLLAIWADVLKMDQERLNIEDNFFELGGHSLKAAILINRINKLLGATLTLNSIFEKPTIRLQAESIKVAAWLSEGKDVVNPEKQEITL